MSLTAVIARMRTGTYTVTRRTAAAPAYDTSGVKTADATSTFSIEASVQNISGRNLRNLPEGQHADDVRVLYTETELRPRTPTVAGDRLVIDSESYEVFRVRKASIRATYYRCYVSRKVVA